MCNHIDLTTLTDGTYDLVSEFESEQCEAQVNLIEVDEDPNQRSEEPPTSFAQEDKPWCMIPVLKFMQLLFLFICAFKFIGVDWNPSCMTLGTYVLNTKTRSSSSCSANRYGISRVVSCHLQEL
jgi:hypothetical protein